jgi:hypothetical protein
MTLTNPDISAVKPNLRRRKTVTKLQKLAGETRGFFHSIKRGEDSVWVTTDDRPDWVQTMCHEAHGDMMPDDWRYEFIVEALTELEDTEDADDINLEADIYTHDLTAWLHSRADRYSYCDEAFEEYGADPKQFPNPMISLLQWGQVREKEEVLNAVRSFLESRIEDAGDDPKNDADETPE